MARRSRFANAISTRRQALGLSQHELASRLGVAKSTVERWERSLTVPHARQLPPLAETLDAPLDELAKLRQSALKHRARRPRRARSTARPVPPAAAGLADEPAGAEQASDLAATLTELAASQVAAVAVRVPTHVLILGSIAATVALWALVVAVAAVVWRLVR